MTRTAYCRIYAVAGIVVVTCCTVWCGAATAAQLRLRSDVHPSGALVLLGDVAEIVANDANEAQRLSATELFPTPSSARKRFLDVHELRDLLLHRKVNLSDVTFSGASRITIHSKASDRHKPDTRARIIAPAQKRRTEDRVREAVIDHLRRQTGTEGPWTVRFSLAENQLQVLAAPEATIAVAGGRPPWTGSQSFAIHVDLPEGSSSLAIDTTVTLPPAVIVAARPLTRGTLIREGDIRLDFRSDLRQGDVTFGRLDEVIGLETTQSIAAGEAMVGRQLRKPLLVKSGDAVTVYARSGGIQVRTVARSRESGSLGELVRVESLNDRKSYLARVSGIQKVEVYARAIAANRPGFDADSTRRAPSRIEMPRAPRHERRRAVHQNHVSPLDRGESPSPAVSPRTSDVAHDIARRPMKGYVSQTIDVVGSSEPSHMDRRTKVAPSWIGKPTDARAVSNPATRTRLRWTRRRTP